jgi:hypothetical protein
MDRGVLVSFDVAPDGSLQNVRGAIGGQVPDAQLIRRLLYAAKKALQDEEVVGITVNSDKYVLKLSANGPLFSGLVTVAEL